MDRNDEQLARLLVRPVDQGGAGSRVLQVRIKPPHRVPVSQVHAAARMAFCRLCSAVPSMRALSAICTAITIAAKDTRMPMTTIAAIAVVSLIRPKNPEAERAIFPPSLRRSPPAPHRPKVRDCA